MVKFKVHTEGIFDKNADMTPLIKRLSMSATKTEHELALQVAKDTSPFVPALTGSLDERTRVDGGTIIYPGPYARYLYYGKVMVDPATGSTFAPEGGSKVVTDRNLVFNQTANPQAQDHWFEASKAQNLDKWIRAAKKAVKNGL